MAEIQEAGNGRNRPKNLELNLVPFIDLMSVLITFLLITAVWQQVSMIQIGASIYGKRNQDQPPPPIPEEAQIPLKLDITTRGYVLTVAKQRFNFPLVNGDFDDPGLSQQLEMVKQQYPTKQDAAIAIADELPYERLIKGMDNFLKTGFSQISVLTGGPK